MDQGIESGLGEGNRPVDGYPGRLDGLESPLSSVIPAPDPRVENQRRLLPLPTDSTHRPSLRMRPRSGTPRLPRR